jgi:ubiquinone/menaquinone biosynthesis C-methylase UbiE
MSLAGRIYAAAYDRMSAGTEAAGLGATRESLLAGAAGRVLEIGAGTGANLPFYGAAVESLTVTEPDAEMARRLERRLRQHPLPFDLIRARAEELPFDDGQFDIAVSTLVLCTVDDQARALGELRRVLGPTGRLLFIEHVRSDEPRLADWQDRLNGMSRVLGRGCNCNRRTLDAIRAAGFTVTWPGVEKLRKAPPTHRPLAVGTANLAGLAERDRAESRL